MSFNSYQVPGVYVQGTEAQLSSGGALTAPVVTLIGQAQGYILASDTITLTTSPIALTQRGVLPNGVAVNLSVSTLSGTVLAPTTDYVITWGSLPNDVTTITGVNSSTLAPPGTQVVVSYSYADSTYYLPKLFTDLNSVQSVYGPALTSTIPTSPTANQVTSPLSMAAAVAFANGAATVMCVALQPPVGSQTWVDSFNTGMATIATNPDANLVVPILAQPSGVTNSAYITLMQSIANAVKVAVSNATAAGFGRIAFMAPDVAAGDLGTITPQALAAEMAYQRIVIAYPWEMQWFNSSILQTTEIGGCYLAAAYAALLASQLPSRGITQLQVQGFVGISADVLATMSANTMNAMSAAGVAVTEVGRVGQLEVRHGTSTDPTSVITREISITRGFDLLYRQVLDGVSAAGLIGDPITTETTSNVSSVVAGVLESAISNSVIAGYSNLQVTQESYPTGNPSAVDVTFTYQPFIPLNYIVVSFSMDLSTGLAASGSSTNTSTTDTNSGL